MKNVTAILIGCRRVGISGSGSNIPSARYYDDNTIRMTVRIATGPEAWLDRIVVVDTGISRFVSALTPQVAQNLLNELSSVLSNKGGGL
jgi:hypothetical protein